MQLIKIMKLEELQARVENAWEEKLFIHNKDQTEEILDEVIEKLDKGIIKIATPTGDKITNQGEEENVWQINEWIKKAILMYFAVKKIEKTQLGIFEFHDKIKLKTGYQDARIVPSAVVRYGTFIGKNTVLMPSYINIGAFIDNNTMIDINAGVGSCAQIGKNVHLSAGAILGGVLEPLQAMPVIIEDNVFIGANCAIVEGVKVSHGAVIAANVCITGSTKIIDITGQERKEFKGFVPPNAVVIPGTTKKSFPAGEYDVSCALIIGKRKDSTDAKVALNEFLRN